MAYNILDTVKVENIVASVKLCDAIDLAAVSAKIPEADYNKRRFPGIVLRFDSPKVAALLFSSGKVVLTGAKHSDILKEGMQHLVRLMKEIGVEVPKNPGYSIQNIVTSAYVGKRINLNKIAMTLSFDKVEYEPEQFPGLVYRIENPKAVVLMFGSGKFIVTGSKNEEDAKSAVLKMYGILSEHGLV